MSGPEAGALHGERPVRGSADADIVRGMLQDGEIHAVTLTSSSTVINFLSLNGGDAKALLPGVVVARIDPITAGTAARHGIGSAVVPEQYTVLALTAALIGHFRNQGAGR